MTTSRLPRHAVTIIIAMALAMTLLATPASAASPTACKVRNVTRGGSYGSLAAAVKEARNGNRLTVRGKCIGRTRIINKRLTIVGVRTSRSGPATLRSNGKGSVLSISGDYANVTVKRLFIKAKPHQVVDYDGGGIYVGNSKSTLRDVKVKGFKTKGNGGGVGLEEGTVILTGTTSIQGNKADSGGGIYNNSGKVILKGRSSVKSNKARWGGGIEAAGGLARVLMKDRSSVRNNSVTAGKGGIGCDHGNVRLWGLSSVTGNDSAGRGGGIACSGSVVLAGSSSVTGNSAAEAGGGVIAGGTLMMSPTSSISGNTALNGGGVKSYSWSTLVGVVCAPSEGANVHGNTPDDCHDG